MDVDDIIVGAGSSGAVLAARLSEDVGRRVLLIEAGPDYGGLNQTPPQILNGRRLPLDHDWNYVAEMVPGRSAAYPRGKIVGGSSSVNACVALRGAPADYDEWATLGNAEWSWTAVRPAFVALENDLQFMDEHHGRDGPTPIQRSPHATLWSAQSAFLAGCQSLGFPRVADHNHPMASGAGLIPSNLGAGDTRMSTALVYLQPPSRRVNLAIRADCLANRVVFDGSKAVGVEIASNGRSELVRGRRVTLCAGAIGSAAILLRSGVGPAGDLSEHGIAIQVDAPGVGRNLIDHACLRARWAVAPAIVADDAPHVQAMLTHTASGSNVRNDMQAFLFQWQVPPSLWLQTSLMKPLSRGCVRLRSPDSAEQPEIRLNLASEPEDVRRLADGLRLLGRLLRTPSMTSLNAESISLIEGEVMPAARFGTLLQNDAWVADHVRRAVQHYVHPVGTARMGSRTDREAVVDQHGKVHGTSALYVVDASIMPTIPRANTHLTCVMIAERVAGWMRREQS